MARGACRPRPVEAVSATKQVEERREDLLDPVDAGRPMTLRQVFYRATCVGLSRRLRADTRKSRPIGR